jgi:hypothetical protein
MFTTRSNHLATSPPAGQISAAAAAKIWPIWPLASQRSARGFELVTF